MDWSEDLFIAQTPEHGYFIRRSPSGGYRIIKRDRATGKATRLNVEYGPHQMQSAKNVIFTLINFNNFQVGKEQMKRIIRRCA